MVVLAVYKKQAEEPVIINDHHQDFAAGQERASSGADAKKKSNEVPQPNDLNEGGRKRVKPFVWLHPPKGIELSINDELFVLSSKDPSSSDPDGVR